MEFLFLTILNMSLTGAFVIASICLARLLLKKVPKIISYCLWAVALFRLVFPFSIESGWSLVPFSTQTIPATQVVPSPDVLEMTPASQQSISSAMGGGTAPTMPTPPEMGVIIPEEIAAPLLGADPLQTLISIGAILWLIGFVSLLSYGVLSYLLLRRRMRESVLLYENVYEAAQIQSPFVLGFFAPKIYLPIGLSLQERRYIILHEQTHIRRQDHILKFAAYLALCLHWFNPLVWLAFRLMSTDMEMSCDESVLRRLGSETKTDYSRILLMLATDRRVLAGAPLAFGESAVTERVKNILKFKRTHKIISVIAAVLVLTLGVGLALTQADEVPAVESSQTPETPVLAPNPTPAEFVAPRLIVEEDWHASLPAGVEALSPEEAAQIGAQYIWAMFGESIDGYTVRMAYLPPEWSARTYWRGTVLNLAFEAEHQWMPFEFEIDALTGEWLSISNESVLNSLMDPVFVETEDLWAMHNPPNPELDLIVTEEEWEEMQSPRFQMNLTAEEIQFFTEIARGFASRHFRDSTVTDVLLIELAHPFNFSRDSGGNLIAVTHTIYAEITDDAGRTATFSLCSRTHQLLRIRTTSEVVPGWQYNSLEPSADSISKEEAIELGAHYLRETFGVEINLATVEVGYVPTSAEIGEPPADENLWTGIAWQGRGLTDDGLDFGFRIDALTGVPLDLIWHWWILNGEDMEIDNSVSHHLSPEELQHYMQVARDHAQVLFNHRNMTVNESEAIPSSVVSGKMTVWVETICGRRAAVMITIDTEELVMIQSSHS